ncbi:MAG: hypothetical protein K2W96_10070, partial [Gemmataceae bacterium]|nr:hypothetical protein [Gemmataceae bacterium]
NHAIEQLSSGMPLLVEVFDRLLGAVLGGSNQRVPESQFDEVLRRYDAERDAAARRLAGKEPAYALSPRELELLQMACIVSRENGYRVPDMAAALVQEWELYAGEAPGVKAFDPAGDDPLALDVVQKLGLLPARSGARPIDRLAVVPQGDALWRVEQAARAVREGR